jgi:hypothetical protein
MIPTFEEIQEPINFNTLDRTEKIIGKNFLSEYRQFLLKQNGGRPVPSSWIVGDGPNDRSDVQYFLLIYNGKFSNLLKTCQVYEKRMPTALLPLARDSRGNLICIGTKGEVKGKIYFWVHETETEGDGRNYWENVNLIAPSLREFLKCFFEVNLDDLDLSFPSTDLSTKFIRCRIRRMQRN